MSEKEKIIVLIGQTASGKTATAIKLAKEINGEVISADSRQVYKGLDIGTDKVTQEQIDGVPHHLINVVCPSVDIYTVSDFVSDANTAITDIVSRGKVPIIAGGTMLYIDTLFGNVLVPEVPPNPEFRAEIEQLTPASLFAELQTKDPRRAAQMITEGQDKNKRRLIRALEIVAEFGEVPDKEEVKCPRGPLGHFAALWVGLQNDPVVQKEKIDKRNAEMLKPEQQSKASLLDEVKNLMQQGITQKQFDIFGFEYKYPAMYLSRTPIIKDEPPTLEQVLMKMNSGTWRYAKKQRAWWSGRAEINWFKASEYNKLLTQVTKFLS
ncbi:MAG: tRNA (adenosine(37)-N6)-dimethylallyltransferase MiaA [Candidatus Pacebacteria bacterium]|nr:tRNA (adenosine(37)-N6)-dimethylallyltransferase MiaA [Candidatus Paceibacterota bacterium]